MSGKSARFVRLREGFEEKNPEKVQKPHNPKATDISTSTNSTLTTLTILACLLCLQIAISVNPHSGQSQPPMFGDYEAQRHWMEITYNLPIEQWYINGTLNDLLYWGLDYPPLTAYHHWLLGSVSKSINEDWIALETSRGFESVAHKLFMRLSAIIPFFIFYIPPLFVFFSSRNLKKMSTELKTLTILYPGLLIIDNGHFQYNSISLGLFLTAFMFLIADSTLIGSIFFVAALNYKQMELYHALPVFVFILSKTFKTSRSLPEFIWGIARIGTVVIVTFLLIWSPFLVTGTAKDVLIRVFPFNRGVYEDKVASFWCAFSFILKRLPIQSVQIQASTILVLLCSAPSLIQLFRQPSEKNFRISLFTTSISFFLFSFHVHEKTILLAAIPAILLISDFPSEVLWFLNVSNISLFGLCVKDNFSTALFVFFAYFIASIRSEDRLRMPRAISLFFGFSICILELYGPTNQRFPHIYQLINALFSCIHFLYFLLFATSKMFEKSKNE